MGNHRTDLGFLHCRFNSYRVSCQIMATMFAQMMGKIYFSLWNCKGNDLWEWATHSLRWAVISEHKVMVGWGRRADEHWGAVRHQDVSVWLGYGWDLPLIWVNYYGECWTCELTVIIITGIEKSIFSNTDRMFLIEILQAIVNQTIRIHFQHGITPMNAMIPPTITSFGSSSQWKRS